MIGKISLTPGYQPTFRADAAAKPHPDNSDAGINKMFTEQRRAIQSEERRRKASMGLSAVMTAAFLAIAGVTLYPYTKGLFKKTSFQKIGSDIPDYTDDCVNKKVKNAIKKKLEILNKSSDVKEYLGIKDKATFYILHGAPGVGKTLSGKIIAKALNAECAERQFADFSSVFVGETAVNITKEFKFWKKLCNKNPQKQYVLIINEADALLNNVERLGPNSEHLGQNRTAIINGLDIVSDCPNMTIIFTTNINPNTSKLDPATLSRMIPVEIGCPDITEQLACLKYHLKQYPVAKDLLNKEDELIKIAKLLCDKNGTQRDTANVIDSAIRKFGIEVNDTVSQIKSQDIVKEINEKELWAASIGKAEKNPLEEMMENGDIKGLSALWSKIGRFLRSSKYGSKES